MKTAIPITLVCLAELAMSLTDMLFIGKTGRIELSALGLASGAIYPLLFSSLSLTSTSNVMVAEAGMDISPFHLGRILWGGLVVSALAAVVVQGVTVLLMILAGHVVADPRVLMLANQYLAIAIWSIPFVLIFNLLRGILAALDRAGSLGWFAFGMVVSNIVFNIILVVWLQYGLSGSAWATVLSNLVLAGLVVILVLRRICIVWNPSFFRLHDILLTAKDYLRIGLPVSILTLLESAMFMLLAIRASSFGIDFMAAHTIAWNVCDIGMAFSVGIGEAVTLLVARARVKNFTQIKDIMNAGTMLVTIISVLIAVPLVVDPSLGTRLFLSRKDVADVYPYFVSLTPALAALFIFDGIQSVQSRALKGMRDVQAPMLMASASYWMVGVGMAWMLSTLPGLEGAGLWWGILLGMMTASLALGFRCVFILRVQKTH